jgi:hypothetical protein
MDDTSGCWMSNEDWVQMGKADAWAGRPKLAPEHDPQAASMYDLGYSEGGIAIPPIAPSFHLSPMPAN